jgi:ADP-heptose:LPS heptosyltransferase
MPERARLEIPSWPEGEAELARVLGDRLEESGRAGPLIVIQPGAFWPPRAWRVERFAAVAAALHESYDATIVLLGTAEEAPLAEAMDAASAPRDALRLFGALSLPAVAALLRRARLYIGNDGGIAHIAAACGTESIVLFGPEDADRFRPWSPRTRVLQHPDHCVPRCRTVCRREEPCVNLVTTSDVLAAARETLGPGVTASPARGE